ncbi:M48 family metallopeptidase [Rhizobium sp. NLR9b]|uniref:M48 family metallopeptidase n=1 Tax=unclassified Rhizobium TaxID=2613769 RepID=UPI001C834D32|nr:MULTISPECIES: M48 family metallopeptidase [unclassified Rhizobium]MBX5226543.1 M48 family metallopeptidase [Rhizobium sp. NLR9b]MBX5287215.1 M48 family metallopeptidase [Rhizobium sp. NLR10b]
MVSDTETIAKGEWFPPHSSGAVPARLRSRGGRLVAMTEEDAILSDGDAGQVSFTPRVGSIPRRAVFANGSVFESADNDAIDAFLRGAGRSGWVHRLEEFHPRIFVFVIAVLLLAVGIYRYALPALVEVAIFVTPPVVSGAISYGALNTLDNTAMKPSRLTDLRQAEIAGLFRQVAANAEGGAERYVLNFRDGGLIGANAFALPDGNIIITDQLVDLAGGDDEMISGVLAHEIGHVEYKHSLRQLYRAAGVAGLVMLIAGDIGSGVEDILTQGGGLLALSYSRNAEAEADRRSVELMGEAGMNPASIARFFDLLEEELGDRSGTSMLSSHPGTPERKQAILDYAGALKQD